ncbi:helix-turn-helix transcriptional regulator [Kitasatospora sp. NBC_00240]|uniref:winged helix-turn-helix transcriptional regulator n=1 Tax=Kitasatospora sp. NBC_00240 TaxID=2903567 RepID=UPI002250271D|nr:helix-turn-helix domain-containing protein [Kitasatospora sp. NBC_00240]MCX5209914.1 helix-turn-helix transcriptional regulator [Kitasatospora sp. NBC_00240]
MTARTAVPPPAAAAPHAESRDAYQADCAACPTNRVLDRMGDKWVGLVLKELAGGPQRYGELARSIPGASQKMLTQTLRRLERDGLLSRTVTPAVPVRVDYELTPLGLSLLPVLNAVTRWAEQNIGQVDRAREAYDARQG